MPGENYRVTGATLADLVAQVNFVLGQIADRLDELEGVRGTTEVVSEGVVIDDGTVEINDADGEKIHSLE